MPTPPKMLQKHAHFGAEGIGLFRTEHMFYGKNAEKPLFLLRKMIASKTEAERRKALERTLSVRKSRHQGHHGSHGRIPRYHPYPGSAPA